MKTKVVLGQLGSPKSPQTADVRRFLKEFLGDPRVVDLPQFFWKIILYCFVLPFRPKKSGEAYGRIWKNGRFPLIENTEKFANEMRKSLSPEIELNHGFLLSSPRPLELMNQWSAEPEEARASKLIFLPQFPQYSESTVASAIDQLFKALEHQVNIPHLEVVTSYHRLKPFIDHSVLAIKKVLEEKKADHLVISFHGLPLRRITQKKDVYFTHCAETFALIVQQLQTSVPVTMAFQSRFGSEQWLGPATDEMTKNLVGKGFKKVAVYCPSFVVDCLETTDEIGNELGHEIRELGAELYHVPCLNDGVEWARDYAHFVNDIVNLGLTQASEKWFYKIDSKEALKMAPIQEEKVKALTGEQKSILKMVFLTLFIDLMGFSIIFPLFPALAKYYLSVDADSSLLQGVFSILDSFVSWSSENGNLNRDVLFGGMIGAVFSLAQFLMSPIWGGLSDRYGRKPIMYVSLLGTMLSYAVWMVSGNFTLFILSRLIGGLTSGNISTATAIIADITDEKTRSKGMAFTGIAYALGFIFGPAIGGLLSKIDLTSLWGALTPFSTPAIFAFILSLINFTVVARKLPETLKKDEGFKEFRTANPFVLFSPLPVKSVNYVNLAYFIFLSSFSGMEFTLTFLAAQKLNFSPAQNGMMFVFVGFVLAMMQGGYVRRKAHFVGEKKMAMRGLVTIIPGLALLAITDQVWKLYLGLTFMAMGSSMIIPCLTSLVSLYSPAHVQGRSLGIFRSLGALGRVIGPTLASAIFWRFGGEYSYLVGIVLTLISLAVLSCVEPLKKN